MKKSAPLALLLALFPATVWAGLPTGLEIATKAHDSQEGYEGQRFGSITELYDPKGKLVVKYKMMQFAVEGTKANGEETKSLIRFLAPAASGFRMEAKIFILREDVLSEHVHQI